MCWYKDGFFWRKPSPQWEIANYGVAVDGKGDLIFNTCTKIIEDKEDSWWTHEAIWSCMMLLEERERWPDRMNQLIDATNWFQWKWSQLLWKLNIRKAVMYRPQKNMTRDGYIAYFTCRVMFKYNSVFIESLKIPWYLYRPHIWAWRKLLIKPNKWSLFIFRLGMKLTFCNKQYVIRLRELMEGAIMIIVNDRVNKLIN